MTPEDIRADKIIAAIGVVSAHDNKRWKACREMIAYQLKDAKREAYEECAHIAESYGIGEGVSYKNLPRACEDIAAAIRARAKEST
jgi:hypothetical protein